MDVCNRLGVLRKDEKYHSDDTKTKVRQISRELIVDFYLYQGDLHYWTVDLHDPDAPARPPVLLLQVSLT